MKKLVYSGAHSANEVLFFHIFPSYWGFCALCILYVQLVTVVIIELQCTLLRFII